jgi:glutamate dehydrogenase (NADP+)
VFTNALTGCNLGAAVGGADFNPANKSEAEVQRFCEVGLLFMSLYHSDKGSLGTFYQL